ncbi:phosphotriesterase [Chloroflexota bacterium]
MTAINSVLGPLDTADLGFTLMHEHVMIAPPGVFQDYPELFGADPLEHAVRGLKKAKEGGVDTIVDATTLDLGRDINLIAEASRRSGVNIIACTGWWVDVPRFFAGISADQLAEVFTREVEQGISGTNIKAGILKSASDMAGLTPETEVVLRAVARAHHKTGVPIMLHSYSPGRVGQEQLAVLKEESVGLRRVKLDHSNDTTDVEYLIWILEQGCYLGMDRYPYYLGSLRYHPGRYVDSIARTRTLKALIDAGYGGRLCPSHDWITLRVLVADPYISEEERARLNPHGYLYVKNVVISQLREMGVSESILNSLCIDGPRNFFEGV